MQLLHVILTRSKKDKKYKKFLEKKVSLEDSKHSLHNPA